MTHREYDTLAGPVWMALDSDPPFVVSLGPETPAQHSPPPLTVGSCLDETRESGSLLSRLGRFAHRSNP